MAKTAALAWAAFRERDTSQWGGAKKTKGQPDTVFVKDFNGSPVQINGRVTDISFEDELDYGVGPDPEKEPTGRQIANVAIVFHPDFQDWDE